jgi:acetyl esterase/lipase
MAIRFKEQHAADRSGEEGYAIASVDYRLSTEARFPRRFTTSRLRYGFARHSDEWRLTSKKIVIAGDSAGAHLAALVGVPRKQRAGRRDRNDRSQSSDVQGIISFYGAANLTTILSQSTPHGLKVRIPALELLLGGQPRTLSNSRALRVRSFTSIARSSLLLFHGDQDPQMPINQSHELHGAYRSVKARLNSRWSTARATAARSSMTLERLAVVKRFLRKAILTAQIAIGVSASFGRPAVVSKRLMVAAEKTPASKSIL